VLVILEAAADLFGGNEIARAEVRQFLGLLRRMGRATDASVLLLQHPSMTGLKDGTGTAGSLHWRNTARPFLFFSKPDDDDTRTLAVQKNNYAAAGESVSCRWQNGVFVPMGVGSMIARAAAALPIDEAFMRCLDAATLHGRTVSDKTGINYAPAVFEAMPEAGGIKSKAFALAMPRLFSARRIKVITEGSPKRSRSRIVRNEQ
jgi:RecA-family ATPase